jgi:hypothetical protein
MRGVTEWRHATLRNTGLCCTTLCVPLFCHRVLHDGHLCWVVQYGLARWDYRAASRYIATLRPVMLPSTEPHNTICTTLFYGTQGSTVACCATPYCAVCAVLCNCVAMMVIVCYIALFCVVLHCAVCCIAQCVVVMSCNNCRAQCCAVLGYPILGRTLLCCTMLCYFVRCYTLLDSNVLRCDTSGQAMARLAMQC